MYGCGTNYEIGVLDVDLKTSEALSHTDEKQVAIVLASEFYKNGCFDDGVGVFLSKIKSGESRVHSLWTTNNPATMIGVSLYNIYEWERIYPQLYYKPIFNDNSLKCLSLVSFGDLVCCARFGQATKFVAELSYNFILPRYRNRGYGRKLFESRLVEINNTNGVDIIFALAMSPLAGTEVVALLLEYFLDIEKSINGLGPDGRVNVSGVVVPSRDISNIVGFDAARLDFSFGVPASTHMLQSAGFVPIGFSKNLSPVWVLSKKPHVARLYSI